MSGSEGERSFPDFAVGGETQAAAAVLAQSDALLHRPQHRGCPPDRVCWGVRSELVSAVTDPALLEDFASRSRSSMQACSEVSVWVGC